MTMTGFDGAVCLYKAEDTMKQLDTYKFDVEYTVTVEVVDIEPTVMEVDNSSSSDNAIHLNQAVPPTLNANQQPHNTTSKYCLSLDRIAKNLADILCKYYILRAYAASKKQWQELAPYYVGLKKYYFSALASDIAEFILPRSGDCDFVDDFVDITLTLARKTSDNPKMGTYDDVRCLLSEMILFTSRKRKMTENEAIPSGYNMEKSQQTEPPLYAETSRLYPINQNVYPDANSESHMPIITHVTSLSPYKKLIRQGHCVLCAKVTGKICIGCYKNYYCSNTCQTIDWVKHKDVCVLPI